MFWLWLFGFILTIIGVVIAIKRKNRKIIIVLSVCIALLLIGFIILLPGLLFAFSNWKF